MSRRFMALSRPRVHHDALDWARRVVTNGGSVSQSTLRAVSTFCDAIDRAAIRDRFFRLNLFCGNSLSAALVPVFRGQSLGGTQYGNSTDTNNNFVGGDYVETGASGGLLGDGSTKYLSTGLTPAGLPAIATGHLSAYVPLITPGTAASIAGSASGSHRYELFHRLTGGGLVQARSTWGGTTSLDDTGAAGVTTLNGGLWTVTRTSSTNIARYLNGTQSVTSSSSVTPGAHSNAWFVFATNSAGSASAIAGHRIMAYSIGDSMSEAQVSAYYSAMQAFQTALTRNV